MINLKVKTLDSQNHDFTVDEEITVRQFKEQIAQKISVSVELQRLIYCGRVLADDKPLKDYDLNGKVVHLVQRAPPSARGTSMSSAEPSGRGSDEASRASRRSRSSDNASRNIFPGMDDQNTMYFGSMTSIPLNVGTANATQLPSVSSSSTLCNNRISVARHMLDCAESILNYLENPAGGLNYTAMDYHGQQTMESTVFEVGISAVGDMDIPQNEVQTFVNAFQGAVSAAFRQNGMSNVTVQQPDGLHGPVQVFGTVPDYTVETPPNTSATATPAHEGSGTSSSNTSTSSSSSSSSSASSSTSDGSSGSSSASSSTSEGSADTRRTARPGPSQNQTTSTQTLGEVVQQLRHVQRRLEPFLQQYCDILQQDPVFDESDTTGRENAQRVFDRVSETLHFISHAQHAISDLMLDLQMATPRHLCCRPILVEQNAYVSSGMASVPNFSLANLLRNQAAANNNNNNNPEVGNNNFHAQLFNLGVAPAFFAAGGPPGGAMRPPAAPTAAPTAATTAAPTTASTAAQTAAPTTTATTNPQPPAATNAATTTAGAPTVPPRPPTIGQSPIRPPFGGRGNGDVVTSVYIPLYDLNSVRRMQNVLGEMQPPASPAGRRDSPVIIMRDVVHMRPPRTTSADGRSVPAAPGRPNVTTRYIPVGTINSTAAQGPLPNNNNGGNARPGPGAGTGTGTGTGTGAGNGPPHNLSMYSQLQMARLLQAVVNATPMHTDIHVQINTAGGGGPGGPGGRDGSTPPEGANNSGGSNRTTASSTAAQAGNPTNTTTTNTNSNGRPAGAAAGAGPGDGAVHFWPRFATVTLPTTSTQTRSTSRPHVHSIHPTHLPNVGPMRHLRPVPANILSTFDRFLPCNSHHIHHDNSSSGSDRPNDNGSSNRGAGPGEPANVPPSAGASGPTTEATSREDEAARATLASARINIFGSQISLVDLQNGMPNPNILNRVRDSLFTYVNQTLFAGRPVDEESIREVCEFFIDRLRPTLARMAEVDHPDFDTPGSLANLFRNFFPTFVNLVREDRSSQFGVRMARMLITLLRRFFMIAMHGIGRERLLSFTTDLMLSQLREQNVPQPELIMRLILPAVESNLNAAERHDMFDVQQFLVFRQPAPPGPFMTGTGQREVSPMDVDDAESTSTPELVSDIADITISIEPPAMSVDPCPKEPDTSSSPAVTDDPPVPTDPPAPEASEIDPLKEPALLEILDNLAGLPVPPPVRDGEELPVVEANSEPWHRNFSFHWLPIITRDIGRQGRQAPQSSLSDAYLSGMASKRRKVITESKLGNEVHSMISDGVRRVLIDTDISPAAVAQSSRTAAGGGASSSVSSSSSSSSGVSSGSSSSTRPGGRTSTRSSTAANRFRTLDEMANNIANDGALQMSYCEEMKSRIRDRLASDPDYNAIRFPNCSKFFEKQ